MPHLISLHARTQRHLAVLGGRLGAEGELLGEEAGGPPGALAGGVGGRLRLGLVGGSGVPSVAVEGYGDCSSQECHPTCGIVRVQEAVSTAQNSLYNPSWEPWIHPQAHHLVCHTNTNFNRCLAAIVLRRHGMYIPMPKNQHSHGLGFAVALVLLTNSL